MEILKGGTVLDTSSLYKNGFSLGQGIQNGSIVLDQKFWFYRVKTEIVDIEVIL